MKQATRFNLHPGWKLLLQDLGLSAADVLAYASLPGDLFSREGATLSVAEFFGLFKGLEVKSMENRLWT